MGEIIIEIRTRDKYHSAQKAIICPDFFVECFEPMRVNDDRLGCLLDGRGVMAGSDEVSRVVKLREDAAEYIANELARAIVSEMKSKDTINGYVE